MPLSILAIDPATVSGWAHSCGESGTWDMSVKRDESGGMKLIRLRSHLADIKERLGIDVLVFEAARNAGPGMQGALVHQAELQGVIKCWCEENSVNYRGYSPSELKKWATGRGNASKEEVLKAASDTWYDKSITDHNEADALWLLDMAGCQINGARRSSATGDGQKKKTRSSGSSTPKTSGLATRKTSRKD